MGELIFVGMGLHDEMGLSLSALKAVKECDHVFLELYTSRMAGLSLERLGKLVGKEPRVLSRPDLEENVDKVLLEAALGSSAALLVPGDPMTATTHVDIRLRAEKKGIKTRIFHGASVLTAVGGATGLQSYKFGRTCTIPAFAPVDRFRSLYGFVKTNLSAGLHSLLLLDTADERFGLPEALESLLMLEGEFGEGLITHDTLMVGVARIGSPDMMVKADRLGKLRELDFGTPPHCAVYPGKLHFMEAEALRIFASAPADILGEHDAGGC